jgi:hypothetical protein
MKQPQPSLEDSAGFVPSGFNFFGFATVILYRTRSLALCPVPYLQDQVSAFMSPATGWSQFRSQAPGPLSSPSGTQGYGGGILTRLHTGSSEQVTNNPPPWSQSASELYRPSDRRLSAKWLPTFTDRGCHLVSVTDHYGRILGFLDRSRYFSIK